MELYSGSGFLYGLATFQFMSPYLMNNYITLINPRLTGFIANINLHLKATNKLPNPFTPSLFRSLATLSSLRSLEIKLVVEVPLCNCVSQQSGHVYTQRWSVSQKVLNRWDQAEWEMLGGKSLKELCIKVRSVLGLVIRNESSYAWIEGVRGKIGGCGGDSDVANGVGTIKASARGGNITEVFSDEDL
jgi:hypothetical protein